MRVKAENAALGGHGKRIGLGDCNGQITGHRFVCGRCNE